MIEDDSLNNPVHANLTGCCGLRFLWAVGDFSYERNARFCRRPPARLKEEPHSGRTRSASIVYEEDLGAGLSHRESSVSRPDEIDRVAVRHFGRRRLGLYSGPKRLISRNKLQFSVAASARAEKGEAEAKQDSGAGLRSLYEDNVVEVGEPSAEEIELSACGVLDLCCDEGRSTRR